MDQEVFVGPCTDALNPRPVVRAMLDALASGANGALALVVETKGSTYAGVGQPVLFVPGTHHGWLSGGCMEPEVAERAAAVALSGQLDWMVIDSRDDAALFSGAATGCRGYQRLALIPLQPLAACAPLLQRWCAGSIALHWSVRGDGELRLEAKPCRPGVMPGEATRCRLPLRGHGSGQPSPGSTWRLHWPGPPRVVLYGTGPETRPLLTLLEQLGWQVQVQDARRQWRSRFLPDAQVDAAGTSCVGDVDLPGDADVALVMHHGFEADRDALEYLAGTRTRFIGLLGPARRRDDLLKLLPAASVRSLQGRLHGPVGLPLGGRGPEAIALSIVAQLQAWRHGRLDG